MTAHPHGSRAPAHLALVVLSLLISGLFTAGCRSPADGGPYEAWAKERELRAPIVAKVLAGAEQFRDLPRGLPHDLESARKALQELEQPLATTLEGLQAEVERASAVVAEKQTALTAVEASASMYRIKERKVVGYRTYGNDWYGYSREAVHKTRWKVCGNDGCGGACGACAADEPCFDGYCRCVPSCDGKSCGSDGCGGTCGACGPGNACDGGACVAKARPDATPACQTVCPNDDPAKSDAEQPGLLGKLLGGNDTPPSSADAKDTPGPLVGRGDALAPARLHAWLEALDAAIRNQDAAVGSVESAARDAARLDGELAALTPELDKANAEAKAALGKQKEARSAARNLADDPDVQQLLQMAAARVAETKADAERLQAQVKATKALRDERRKTAADGLKMLQAARAYRQRLVRERDLFALHAEQVEAAKATLAAAEAQLAQVQASTEQRKLAAQAAVKQRLDAAKARLSDLEGPVVATADRPQGHIDDPRAPESPSYAMAGMVGSFQPQEERLDRYAAALAAALESRRDAWERLDADGKKKHAEWPQGDERLAVHLYHVQALIASNKRMRSLWDGIQP